VLSIDLMSSIRYIHGIRLGCSVAQSVSPLAYVRLLACAVLSTPGVYRRQHNVPMAPANTCQQTGSCRSCADKEHGACCRHAQRLLKYGFDLGPQFSADTNLPPDDGDSVPATVRRNAPSNVVLNIADLRSSMHEAALNADDGNDEEEGDLTAGVKAVLESQQISLEGQQLMSPLENDHSTSHQSTSHQNASADNHSQDSYRSNQSGTGSRQGTSDTSHGSYNQSQHGLSSNQSASTAVLDDLSRNEPVANQQPAYANVQQDAQAARHFDRNMSAMRGSRSRPQLSSVRFAEESDEETGLQSHGLLTVRTDASQAASHAPPPPDPGGNL